MPLTSGFAPVGLDGYMLSFTNFIQLQSGRDRSGSTLFLIFSIKQLMGLATGLDVHYVPADRKAPNVSGKHAGHFTLMQQQKDKENISGRVRIDENKICWDYYNKTVLEIDAADIVVIGEYTNTAGPWFDDWFITFVTKDGNWQSLPWYVDNRDQLTDFLCIKFQPDLNVSFLTSSTSWESVVRFPSNLKGQKLFETIPSNKYKKPKSFLDKIISSIGLDRFDTSFAVDLTDNVKNEIQNACR